MRILKYLKYIKYRLDEILNDTHGECSIDFTLEQSTALIGLGRIDENKPIDLREYVIENNEVKNTAFIRLVPKPNNFSMKIGGTQFNVTTHFNCNGRESVLQQFKDLILRKRLV